MAREFPIHNGRMTTDLDANGHKIKNLPPGSEFTQVQSDWGQTDTTAPDFIKNKPPIPAPVAVDSALSQTSENPVQNKVIAAALYTGFTEWVCEPAEYDGKPVEVVFVSNMMLSMWRLRYVSSGEQIAFLPASMIRDDLVLEFSDVGITATRHLITPTKTSQLTNDSGFLTQHQDISGKLDGAAAYPAWDSTAHYLQGIVVSYGGRLWKAKRDIPYPPPNAHEPPPDYDDAPWDEVFLKDLKQDALSSAQIAAVNSGATAAKVATWDGYAAQIAAKANASDVAIALAQKANTADLPYAMVTPGEWEFSGSGYDSSKSYSIEETEQSGVWYYDLEVDGDYPDQVTSQTKLDVVNFPNVSLTATRNVLHDRAGNRVIVTGDTTLTLPALEHAGRLRDFLVRLEISGSTIPTITFAAPTGETITYETDGDEFPVPDEAGTWLYSFTESCVAHKFAVSLKKVNAVTQTQGGS